MTEQSLLIKTKGWAIYGNTGGTNITTIEETADWYTWTNNERFAWAETQKIELTGIAAKKMTVFPMAWSIQEMTMPDGFCWGEYQGSMGYNGETPDATGGMPWYCEIHDFWTTRPFTDSELNSIAGAATLNYQWGPGMDGWAASNSATFMDFEQVIAARSRIYGPSSNQLDYQGLYPTFRLGTAPTTAGANAVISPAVRRNFNVKLHDCQWGSGEPIGTIDVYHTRVMISNLDTESNNTISENFSTYVQIPPSIQPMLVAVEKPPFLSRMTYERRSKGV